MDDQDTSLIVRMKHGRLFLNRNQCFKGRVIYVYHKHIDDISQIDVNHYFEADKEIIVIAKAIKRIFNADLINAASLGNHVQHLHWHIIPRYKNDPNWGNPPWPHGVEELTEAEQKERCLFIRNELVTDKEFKALDAAMEYGKVG